MVEIFKSTHPKFPEIIINWERFIQTKTKKDFDNEISYEWGGFEILVKLVADAKNGVADPSIEIE